MELNELEKLIKERRSIRKWKKEEVPDGLLTKAIELATWAPNGGNFQGWHFIVTKNRETITRIADSVQAIVEKIISWPEAAAWQEETKRYRQNASFFRHAPACIGVFASEYRSLMERILMARDPSDEEARRLFTFRRSAPTTVQSTAAAVTTMLLVFHQMGLGAVWLAAPLLAKKEIESTFNVSSELSLTALVAVGYADESPRVSRKPLDQVMEFRG